MHVTVGYWIHGVTILHEEGTRKADEAGASGSPSDKGLGDSPHAQQNGTLQSFVYAFSYLVCAVVYQCSHRLYVYLRSLSYHVRAFPTFFGFAAV